GAEIAFAAGAVMAGVSHQQDTWPVAQRAAEVVQATMGLAVAVAGVTAARARPAAIAPRPFAQQWLGQVLDTGDALGAVWDVLAWSLSHDRPLCFLAGPIQQSRSLSLSQQEPVFLATESSSVRSSNAGLRSGYWAMESRAPSEFSPASTSASSTRASAIPPRFDSFWRRGLTSVASVT